MKKLISVIIILTIALSLFALPETASAAGVIKKTMMQFKDINLTFKMNEKDSYNCKVENNDSGYLKVNACNEGDHYWLMVYSLKPTEKKKPKITITDSKDGSVVKRFEITVTPAKKVAMKDVKLQVGSTQVVTIKNPYFKDYTLKYNKKILKYKWLYVEGSTCRYTFKTLKKGSTTVKASIKGKLLGSFKVTVGDFKAAVKKKYQTQTLKYNKHITAYTYYEGGMLDIGDAIKNVHKDAVYTVKLKDKTVAAVRTLKKTEEMPKRAGIYSLKPGKTTAAVYEQRGKNKKTEIGTITLTVKNVKDSEVVSSNMMFDNDGLFYESFISPGQRYDLKSVIVNRYINCEWLGSHFDENEYSFTFTASPPEVITVDENGIVTCHSVGNGINSISYTVTFADGSKIGGSGSFDIYEEDEMP